MREHTNYDDECSSISNTKNFYVNKKDCDIHVDIVIEDKKKLPIWGYVLDCKKRPIKSALVKLFKYSANCNLDFVAKTYTDCKGLYKFTIPADSFGKYIVSVCNTFDDCCFEVNECYKECLEPPRKNQCECSNQNECYHNECECCKNECCQNECHQNECYQKPNEKKCYSEDVKQNKIFYY